MADSYANFSFKIHPGDGNSWRIYSMTLTLLTIIRIGMALTVEFRMIGWASERVLEFLYAYQIRLSICFEFLLDVCLKTGLRYYSVCLYLFTLNWNLFRNGFARLYSYCTSAQRK